MMQDRVEIATEKKVWVVPSLDLLQITQTFGGQGDFESDIGGSGPTGSGG